MCKHSVYDNGNPLRFHARHWRLMSGWLFLVLGISILSLAALVTYLRRSALADDRVLIAHGLILLVGLVLAGLGVAALKVLHI